MRGIRLLIIFISHSSISRLPIHYLHTDFLIYLLFIPTPSFQMPSMPNSIAYRPDIDGLRAIAVLGVVFYHADLQFPGGYVGVDVFFVISGFLITSLLLKDLRRGTFSLLNFWERRARRILPALAVVVAAIIAAGWFSLMPADYETVGKEVIALICFSSNIMLSRQTGYFENTAGAKPLLHTWSLSVEEQFYLLIPLLLAALFWLRRPKWIAPIILLGSFVSLCLAVYYSYNARTAAFFLLPYRAWELAAGTLVAFAQPIQNTRLRTPTAWLGLAAILVPFFFYPPGIRFPGLTALPPVVGAALLIWSGIQLPNSSTLPPVPNRLLSARPFVWIGLVSYSLYLWHWPLFAFQKYLSLMPASLPLRLSLVVSSFMLSWFSLHFIERPFRSRSLIRSRNHVFMLSAVTVGVVALASLLLWKTGGAKNRLSSEAQRVAAGATDFTFKSSLTLKDIPELPPKVLVWGDSHAMAIMPAVDIACKNAGISARGATASATVPVMEWFCVAPYGLNENAPAFNAAVMDYIKRSASEGLSLVILAARWEYYLNKQPTPTDQFRRALHQTVDEIQATGCRVVVLIDVPSFSFNPPRALTVNSLLGRNSNHLVINSAQYLADTALQRPILSELSQQGVTVIDPAEFFTDANGIIHPSDNMGALYRDPDHLSTYGSKRLTALFSKIISAGG